MGVEAIIIAESVKFLLMVAFAEARKAGLSSEQILEIYLEERKKFDENDPVKIPDPT